MLIVLLGLVALLAFANGANDNGKGVATLVSYGAAKPRAALVFASVMTALGGIVSFWMAGGLLKSFSVGLFASGVTLGDSFFVAVLIGAVGWVVLATRVGMPVSTTHAIIGALTGAGLVAFGGEHIRWSMLGTSFAVPLAASPLMSLAIVYAASWPVLWGVRKAVGRCVCVVEGSGDCSEAEGGSVAVARLAVAPAVRVDRTAACAEAGPIAAVTGAGAASGLHWLSCGLISFARGWNDTPKIAALCLLGLAGVEYGGAIGFAAVTGAMTLGGLLAGGRVLGTLANKLSTPLPLGESLTASLVTAGLVLAASQVALPVSTTHVATGSIIGAGLKYDRKRVNWGKIRDVVLSWVVTLPVAAVIAAGAKLVLP